MIIYYMPSLEDFDSITQNINIPTNIKQQSIIDTEYIINDTSHYIKNNIGNILDNYAYSLKIEPLSYVDEKKYYTYIDAAYKIYEQLTTQKNHQQSPQFAWCIANVAMYNWYFRNLFGYTMSGIEVESEVDYAIRSPFIYIIKNCLEGLIKMAAVGTAAYFGFNNLGMTNPQLHLLSFYVISSIINFIKVSIRIYKGTSNGLDTVRPSA